jgi:hypothetical protein
MPSSVIRGISYDEVTGTLFVTFTSGDLYAYTGVPADTFEAFKGAFSKGRFFARHIRDQFPYRQLDAEGFQS